MERAQTLILNEETLEKLPEPRKSVFIYEWLQYLSKVLPNCSKDDIKGSQKKIVEQIMAQVQHGSPGPPVRELLAVSLSTLFSVGDTFLLFDTINKCNDLLKNKDDSPSFLSSRLAAIVTAGVMYERLGRMMGRSYEETVQVLTKGLKNAESQGRAETMVTLGKVCKGLGVAAGNVHRDIYKACRTCLTDRAMPVRIAAANCLLEMLDFASFLYTTEFENLCSLCFRAFDSSVYQARLAVAKLLGSLVAYTQGTGNKNQGIMGTILTAQNNKSSKSIEDALGVLIQGFLKGGVGSFLKGGSSSVSAEIRVGVSHAFVFCFKCLGQQWVERNLSVVISQVFELVTSPKSGSTHTEFVCARNSVNFILSAVLGRMLREKSQLAACKELVASLIRSQSQLEGGGSAGDLAPDLVQHWQVCALHQLGYLARRLGTVMTSLISDTSLKLLDTVFSCLLSASPAVRLAAASCLRDTCVSVPSVLTPLIDKSVEAMEKFKSTPEAISGYSCGLAALLGSVHLTPNGIPHTRGKIIFNLGEELLRSASQNSRLSKERTRAGWMLIAAIMSLGASVVKGLLPRCMLLWRNAFPRSSKDLESEKARGDAFTWLVSLEARAGALASIHSFVISCPQLHTEDIIRRLSVPLESALSLLTLLASQDSPIKSYSGQLRAPAATVRLRLLEVISVLPTPVLESAYAPLLRLLVSEVTLADASNAPTSTSVLPSLIPPADWGLLGGTDVQDDLNKLIEDQLAVNSAAGSGALEHDPCYLFRPRKESEHLPLPLGVALIDESVTVFGKIFPKAANKHKFQMIQHFKECLKTTKANKTEALQMNIFASILAGLKGMVEEKANLTGKEVITAARDLVESVLTSPIPLLRCTAAESLGRLAQVVANDQVTADMAQKSIDYPKSATDVASRTGHSLALGCLHKYVGGLGASHHLQPSISILLPLSQDAASPVVQAWALHALALLADSGGPMFRTYVEPTLTSLLKLLLTSPPTQGDVLVCLGKLLQAIITTLGPELSVYDAGVATARSNILIATSIMQTGQPQVQAESILCLQQLHMFAPRQIELTGLVPRLVKLLRSSNLSLRRAAVACLRQLSQRESRQICEIVSSEANIGVKDTHKVDHIMAYSDSGLPGILFSLLDQEEDKLVIRDCKETLLCLLGTLASENLSSWINLCKEILTTSSDSQEEGREDRDEIDEDDATFTKGEDTGAQGSIQPRWSTQVFAAVCLRKIISDCCQGDRAHFDLSLAKEVSMTGGRSDFLVLHLTELVRMTFMAATSESDPLKLEGLETLRVVIEKFAETAEPEFPGHVILEQYQAQVGAALRPAFAPDMASHVTSRACAVCSTWISSGVARDLSDLKRVYQLLVTSLEKLKKGSSSSCYNESASTLEKLCILQAWAEVYIVSMNTATESEPVFDDFDEDDNFGDFTASKKEDSNSLSGLVAGELPSLSKHWLAAMKDHALLSLPGEFKSQLPYEGGAFYTNDTIELARPHYKGTWAPILQAACLWLTRGGGFENISNERTELDVSDSGNIGLGPANATAQSDPVEINKSRFHLLLGVCLESLCSPRSGELTRSQLSSCLGALHALLEGEITRHLLATEKGILVELCNVLHRQLLSQESTATQAKIMSVVSLAVRAATEQLSAVKKAKLKEIYPANQSITDIPKEIFVLGEGGEDGVLKPGKSPAFAVLEVCLCVLVRYYPDISPRAAQSSSVIAMQARSRARSNRGSLLSAEQMDLVANAVHILASILSLCSPAGSVTLAPSIFYLVTAVLQAGATKSFDDGEILAESPPVKASIEALQQMVSVRYPSCPQEEERYSQIVQSGLLRILDLVKTAPENTKVDEISLLQAIKVYLLYGPVMTVTAPNVKYPSLNAFSTILQSPSIETRRQCIRILQQIYRIDNPQVSVPYIQSTAPAIIRVLFSNQVKDLHDTEELGEHSDALETLEILINKSQDRRSQMLDIYIPVLVNLLVDESLDKNANSSTKSQHEMALSKLTRVGSQYPSDFKRLLSENEEMKRRVETAVIQNQAKERAKLQASQQRQVLVSQPSIKLKTDFSNFK